MEPHLLCLKPMENKENLQATGSLNSLLQVIPNTDLGYLSPAIQE